MTQGCQERGFAVAATFKSRKHNGGNEEMIDVVGDYGFELYTLCPVHDATALGLDAKTCKWEAKLEGWCPVWR